VDLSWRENYQNKQDILTGANPTSDDCKFETIKKFDYNNLTTYVIDSYQKSRYYLWIATAMEN
jgi:hypothetical protein